ncbi:alkaline protease 1 [Fusarium subglutinans]|uniref:Alkaline protease 1 n=1 Tax=Gibberella subglutinans TaxID=42677 RepID=A0A8H5PBC1_GIBSU|nr:alkaline protease 1 [Fusarium subglutinans]KAF5593391.1 alkaline protease 1 [Fusarium subglutinans]
MTGKDGIRARCLRASRKILGLIQRPDISDTVDHSPEVHRKTKLQRYAPWNLARISQRHARDDDLFQYRYGVTKGPGAYVYVLDTGINILHAEFSGRALYGENFIPGSPDCDENGHGTHMAGIIGGKTFGVAKNCTLISVKTQHKHGQGKMSDMAKGIHWVIQDAARRGVSDRSVINISISGKYNPSVNDAVKKATDAGITVVVSAGNNARFACDYSPASAITAITVAGIGLDDCRRLLSNYGPCVDIFAPGDSIPTASISVGGEQEYSFGTSAAAAHVSGLAAYFISSENLRGFKAVRSRILSAASKGVVKDTRCSSNRLAFNGVSRN